MIFRRYCIQNVKDGIQSQVYNINNESIKHSSQFTFVKVKKHLRKSQAQFRDKLRKLRLKQNDGFLIEKTCRTVQFSLYLKQANNVLHPLASIRILLYSNALMIVVTRIQYIIFHYNFPSDLSLVEQRVIDQ